MKSIALLLLLIGVILITLGISKTTTKACPTQIETRTVTTNYLNNVLDAPDNYQNIFEDRVIGIPDSSDGSSFSYNDNNDDYSNLHNIF